MRKLFKHLKPYAATIAAIVVILIVQAYCDLSLPSYTSDIVNVGIQQGGIDEKIPDAIAEEEMNKLLLFVAEEDQQTVLDAYEKKESDSDYKYDGAIYVLKDSVKKDEEKSGKLFDIFLLNCFSRFFTVRIFPISYCLLHIGLGKLLDNSRMCPFCVIASKQNHFNIPSTFSFNSFVACSISGCPKTALITATPQIPFPASSVTFSSVIPPIATTGMSTVSQISFKTL